MCGRAACDCDDQGILRNARAIQRPRRTSSARAAATANKAGAQTDDQQTIHWANKEHFRPFQCNVSPTNFLTIVHAADSECPIKAGNTADVEIATVEWGIDSPWSHLVINARADSIGRKAFYERMVNHRCVVCVTGYMEWFTSPKAKSLKEPYYFYDKRVQEAEDAKFDPNVHILRLAGIWDGTKKCVIITTDAAPDVQWCHNRMPAILTSDTEARDWIDPKKSFREVQSLLRPKSAFLGWHKIRPDFARIAREVSSRSDGTKDEETDKETTIITSHDVLRKYTPATLDTFFSRKRKAADSVQVRKLTKM